MAISVFEIFACLTRSRFLFFFQAEDGIRDIGVTGVQTCALPISCSTAARARSGHCQRASGWGLSAFAGNSQASALMATTTSGGENSGAVLPEADRKSVV